MQKGEVCVEGEGRSPPPQRCRGSTSIAEGKKEWWGWGGGLGGNLYMREGEGVENGKLKRKRQHHHHQRCW